MTRMSTEAVEVVTVGNVCKPRPWGLQARAELCQLAGATHIQELDLLPSLHKVHPQCNLQLSKSKLAHTHKPRPLVPTQLSSNSDCCAAEPEASLKHSKARQIQSSLPFEDGWKKEVEIITSVRQTPWGREEWVGEENGQRHIGLRRWWEQNLKAPLCCKTLSLTHKQKPHNMINIVSFVK